MERYRIKNKKVWVVVGRERFGDMGYRYTGYTLPIKELLGYRMVGDHGDQPGGYLQLDSTPRLRIIGALPLVEQVLLGVGVPRVAS